MSDVTRLLDAATAATRGRRRAVAARLRRAAQARRRRGWPGEARARPSSRPPWSTRRTCGWSARTERTLGQPRPLLRRRRRGHAPHPRRSRPPQGSREAGRRARSASTSTGSTDRRPPTRPTTSWPWTTPSSRLARSTPRPPKLVKLRFFAGLTVRRGRRRLWACRRRTADRHWAFARAWLRRCAGEADCSARVTARYVGQVWRTPQSNWRIDDESTPPEGPPCRSTGRRRPSSSPPSNCRAGPAAAYPGRGLWRRPGPAPAGRAPAACAGRRRFLEARVRPTTGAGEDTDDAPAAASKAPARMIGPYKLLEQIGEGGMGTVWMAEQTEPVKRPVAAQGHQGRHGLRRCSPASRPSGRPWP